MATWKLPPQVSTWIDQLSQPLHAKLAWRLTPLLTGMLFAQGRRTVASWLRAAALGDDYEQFFRLFYKPVDRTQAAIWALNRRLFDGADSAAN